MRTLFILLAIAVAISCRSRTGSTKISDSAIVNTITGIHKEEPQVIAGCYMEVLKRDTFTASLQQQGNIITGKLVFNNYEKDGSTGSVQGTLEADIIKLNYRFSSEGMSSVMEVYFKNKAGVLIRGTGEMGTKGDSTFFINPQAVKYDGSEFNRISCGDLPAKYK